MRNLSGGVGALLDRGVGYLTIKTLRRRMTHRRKSLFLKRARFRRSVLSVESSLYTPARIFHTYNASA
jgi:hypothetical protein